MSTNTAIDAEEIAKEIERIASEAISEEDLRQGVEYVLKSKVIEKLKEAENIEIPYASWRPPKARYEVTLVSGVRPDALYGHLIIEYEKPGTFGRPKELKVTSGFERAVEQVKGYIRDHAQVEARFPRYFGVVLDGYKIGFVRYREAIKGFESKGPYYVDKNTVAKLIEAIIGLRRKALSAEELLRDFGPESPVAKESIKTLYGKLLGTSPRTQMLFDDWRRVFSQVCAYSPEKIKGLEEVYGFGKGKADPEKLLFALHTYYALIMKLLAAEVASLYVAPRLWSYLKALEDAYYRGHERLKEELKDLEEGGIFSRLGIANFLEADYFAWYLDEWDEEVAKCVMNIVDRLSNYDPSAAELEPERVRDLFKRLYQNLVPKKIRHDLGEYYTPDWLAELVLNEVGWTLETFEKKAQEQNNPLAALDLRLLDPACGSGTFLVLAISRLRQYIEEHWIDKGTALRKITKNVVGFDLNPLAVITSRANYLIALGDLLREKGAEPIEIPIYLADSILVEEKPTLVGATYILRTSAGKFEIPASIVEKGLLAKILSIVEECIKNGYSSNEFKTRLLREVSLEETEVLILVELFETLSKLEREGKNRIWIRVLKNSFAPFFVGEFDYVVGNPPWINWENLPEDYRNSTKKLWGDYGLLERTKGMGLGKVKRDMAMLFIARCMDRYVKHEGIFSFLAPFTIYKTQAGAGFRKHITSYRVLKIHDLVTLYPFEGATNRTSLIVMQKERGTSFSIPCVTWCNPRNKSIDINATLEEVMKSTKQYNLKMIPIETNRPESPWMQTTERAYEILKRRVIGESPWYKAYEGVNTALNQVYWIEILEETPNGLLITNLEIPGQKKKVKAVKHVVEKDLVYPLVRGRNVKRWYVESDLGYTILPVDAKGNTFLHSDLKIRYPNAWSYFINFIDELVRRGGEPYNSKLRPYREMPFESAERIAPPFYWLFNVRPSLSPYKVVWKRIAGAITGKAVSFASAVLEPFKERPVVLNDSLILVPFNEGKEAYYVAGILNSSIVLLTIASYTYELRQETHIIQYVRIPKFDERVELHVKISELSKEAHETAKRYYEQNDLTAYEELRKVESEIDKIVAQLYGLTDEELMEVKKCLAILEGKEMEVEEIGEVPISEPDITIANPVIPERHPSKLEILLTNRSATPISNVKVKLELPTKTHEHVFHKIEKEVKMEMELEGLQRGEHKIRVTVDYAANGESRRIEKTLTVYAKSQEERKPIERAKIDEIFDTR